jgi:hypothetical protein
MPEAVRKLRRSICAWKVLLDFVNLKNKSAGDGYPEKAIERTILRILGSGTFSHTAWPPIAVIADAPDQRRRRKTL